MKDTAERDGVMDRDEVLTVRLSELRSRHRSLDEAILALEATSPGRASLDLRRLKKQKLSLRDQIARLEDETTPDIIA